MWRTCFIPVKSYIPRKRHRLWDARLPILVMDETIGIGQTEVQDTRKKPFGRLQQNVLHVQARWESFPTALNFDFAAKPARRMAGRDSRHPQGLGVADIGIFAYYPIDRYCDDAANFCTSRMASRTPPDIARAESVAPVIASMSFPTRIASAGPLPSNCCVNLYIWMSAPRSAG